ncbi:MAG: phosphate acyltransferase PlsX [Syntrophobacter sp.]
MKIAIDAMGGDNAPKAVVEGALLAQSHCAADLVLVGDEKVIREALGDSSDGSAPDVVHAPQEIAMDESGPLAIRRKRDSSINVAMRMLADGEVDAVVSAGNTSGIVASSRHYVGLFPGLRRPALAVSFPTRDGKPVMLDAGAHLQADAIHLAQSAVLAHIYLKVTLGISTPRIGLLNIGRESSKGTRAVQRAFALIKRSALNFIGNIEPNDLFAGLTDAIICEGFVGNIVLKTYEGLSESILGPLSQQARESGAGAGNELGGIFESFQHKYNYQYVGGAPLLGVKKPVVVAHGRSERTAISNAIRVTCRMAEESICGRMTDELEQDSALADLKYANALLILDGLKKKWGFSSQRTDV